MKRDIELGLTFEAILGTQSLLAPHLLVCLGHLLTVLLVLGRRFFSEACDGAEPLIEQLAQPYECVLWQALAAETGVIAILLACPLNVTRMLLMDACHVLLQTELTGETLCSAVRYAKPLHYASVGVDGKVLDE